MRCGAPGVDQPVIYELTCPRCHATMSRPFVRAGAVAVCKSCQQAFRIQKQHIERRPEAGESP